MSSGNCMAITLKGEGQQLKNQDLEESLVIWILKLDSHIIHVSQSMQTNPLLKRHAYHVHCQVQPLMPANGTVFPQYPAPLVKKIATTNAPFHKTHFNSLIPYYQVQ